MRFHHVRLQRTCQGRYFDIYARRGRDERVRRLRQAKTAAQVRAAFSGYAYTEEDYQ